MSRGPTNEFTLIFKIKPGQGQQLREVLSQSDLEREAQIQARIGTLHDARWALFDDDTRLLFASYFDGDGDVCIDDFAALIPDVFDGILQYAEDHPGIRDSKIKDFVMAHQHAASGYSQAIPGATVKELKKSLRVNRAFQELLDAGAT
ncbi:hypothetical protein [Streptomyces sp. NPDC050485]|uniref:hypothetical protein n=1 Tax=Streptomyces sp. NPDC050485 TaxID=3365617 RepID=UPI0037AED8BC